MYQYPLHPGIKQSLILIQSYKRGQRIKGGSQKGPVKIAFATPLKQVSDYWRRSIDSFKGRMDEIGLDYTVGATIIAQKYISRFKGKANIEYAMLYHIKGSKVSELRGDFFNEFIAEQTSFKLVAKYYTGGNRERARDAEFKILDTHPVLDFIHACSTDVAFGAMDALKERHLTGKILVNG